MKKGVNRGGSAAMPIQILLNMPQDEQCLPSGPLTGYCPAVFGAAAADSIMLVAKPLNMPLLVFALTLLGHLNMEEAHMTEICC